MRRLDSQSSQSSQRCSQGLRNNRRRNETQFATQRRTQDATQTQTQTQIEMLNVGEQESALSGRFASVFTRESRQLRPKYYGNNAEPCRDGAQRARTLSRPALYAPEVSAALGERAKAWHGSPRCRTAGNSCLRRGGPSQTFAGLRCRRARSRAQLIVFARA